MWYPFSGWNQPGWSYKSTYVFTRNNPLSESSVHKAGNYPPIKESASYLERMSFEDILSSQGRHCRSCWTDWVGSPGHFHRLGQHV